ncbi:unnamed protein product [Didymodactylos carnosus]|uniref:DED domain-containing protein n=1 Tax=Didymodactylos carnosus TaxID=1234261 RepID=A0A8S2FE78_9BILA|nr:unnamed protein product [Didymodactylos carnosus]CAF4238509.1 unnamed protein product [Didymodactylos carnosus]
MSNEFYLRGILLKVQDLLSDSDRQKLHFLFGTVIPRRLRDDSKIHGTIQLLEILFDKSLISEQDLTHLIKAFEEIGCMEAADQLKGYQSKLADEMVNDVTNRCSSRKEVILPTERLQTPSLTSILSELNRDLEDDGGIVEKTFRKSFSNMEIDRDHREWTLK